MLYRSILYTFLLLGCVAGFSGCEIINPDEETPSYIRINPFDFDPGNEGANSPKIVDGWVYVNDQLLGAFELPATVPVLNQGTQKVTVRPGVYADGYKGRRFMYAFYQEFEAQVNLVPGQVQTINPVTGYVDNLKFPVNENYSGVSPQFRPPASSVYELEVTSDPAFQFPNSDGKVGLVRAKADTTLPIIIESDFNGKLPQSGANVFLEFDYKSTLDLKVGVEINVQGEINRPADLTLFGGRDWNKVYVLLTEEVSIINNPAANFKVFIQAQPRGSSQDYVAIDNVRLIHF